MIKIYVGCSLLHATQEFRDNVESFKNSLRNEYKILDFVGLAGLTMDPQEVFNFDINCVKKCDLFLAECTYPSTGLGVELGVAFALRKPILAIAQKDAKVSNMVKGMTGKDFSFYQYTNIAEVHGLLKEKAQKMLKKKIHE